MPLLKRLICRICTTDDPVDDLQYHKLLQESEAENGFKVLPAFRPDKVLNIQNKEYADYVQKLATVSDVSIENFADLVSAVQTRIEYFHERGGRLSDHALDTFTYAEAAPQQLDTIVEKALSKEALSLNEINQYHTALLIELMRIYHEKD